MNHQLSIVNIGKLDITKANQFAELVAQAKQAQNVIEAFWGAAEQQMLDRNIKELSGPWGKVSFEKAELLVVTDPSVLDPSVIKPALDTKKVRAYRELMNELPAGVSTKTITKFAKRIEK